MTKSKSSIKYVKFEKSFDLKNLNNDNINNINTVSFDKNYNVSNPFLFKYKNDLYIFYEKVNIYRISTETDSDIGEIYVMKFIDGKFQNPNLVLTENYGLSYPFLICVNDIIYMMPKQNKNSLDIYRCVEFPCKWEKEITILDGKFFNSTICFYDNIFYLFTVKLENNEFIEQLYYNSELISTDWILQKNLVGNSKGAGNIFIHNGKLIRPIYKEYTTNNSSPYMNLGLGTELDIKSTDKYIQELQFLEIELSSKIYTEKIISNCINNIHTINFIDDVIAFDIY